MRRRYCSTIGASIAFFPFSVTCPLFLFTFEELLSSWKGVHTKRREESPTIEQYYPLGFPSRRTTPWHFEWSNQSPAQWWWVLPRKHNGKALNWTRSFRALFSLRLIATIPATQFFILRITFSQLPSTTVPQLLTATSRTSRPTATIEEIVESNPVSAGTSGLHFSEN